MSVQFGRVIELIVGNVKITNEVLRVEFDIDFDDDAEPNVAEVTVYNLSDTTLNQFKKGSKMTINAGYKQDKGVILSGFISKVFSEKGGADRATKITVLDSQPINEKQTLKRAYKKGIKADYILRDLGKSLKLNIASLKLVRNMVYKKGFTVNGSIFDTMKKIAKDCDVNIYISRSQLYIRSIREGDHSNFVLSSDTGLIGSPEYFEEENDGKLIKGYRLKSLLQYRMNTGSIIELKSMFVKGKYRVRKGRHRCSGDDFITEIEVVA